MNAYQSIQTKYLSPTNTRGARIKAITSMGLSVTIPLPYELSYEERHFEAVKALLVKHGLDWGNQFAIGASIDGAGYVFVPVYRAEDMARVG